MRSASLGLPSYGKHVIIETPTMPEWLSRRGVDLLLDDFTSYLDDDDEIHPMAIELCVDALEKTGAGLAFTREVRVYPDLSLKTTRVPFLYSDIRESPARVHNLCVFRREAVMDVIGDVDHDMGVEWMIKMAVASKHGAVHVPIDGYFWYQQPIGIMKSRNTGRLTYRAHIPRIMTKILPKYKLEPKPIPVYDVSHIEVPRHIPEMIQTLLSQRLNKDKPRAKHETQNPLHYSKLNIRE